MVVDGNVEADSGRRSAGLAGRSRSAWPLACSCLAPRAHALGRVASEASAVWFSQCGQRGLIELRRDLVHCGPDGLLLPGLFRGCLWGGGGGGGRGLLDCGGRGRVLRLDGWDDSDGAASASAAGVCAATASSGGLAQTSMYTRYINYMGLACVLACVNRVKGRWGSQGRMWGGSLPGAMTIMNRVMIVDLRQMIAISTESWLPLLRVVTFITWTHHSHYSKQ
jgi:hypothetical protein